MQNYFAFFPVCFCIQIFLQLYNSLIPRKSINLDVFIYRIFFFQIIELPRTMIDVGIPIILQ